LPGGGLPVAPIYRTLESLGIPIALPGTEVSRRDGMAALWIEAGLRSVETRVIRIPVAYSGFDEFWESYRVPEGPAGLVIRKMSPPEIERLKVRLREHLPIAADGGISYEAFANAVKGRAPN
jgi:hypothetical protein